MKKITILLASILFLSILLFLGLKIFSPGGQSTPPPTTTTTFPNTTNASVPNSNGGSTQAISSTTIGVPITVGGTVQVRDFRNDPATLTDSNIPGYHFIAGGVTPSATSAYHIFYVQSDQSFHITLLQEPLGQVRLQAEQQLMQALGINEQAMCQLVYSVGVLQDVSSIYSGQNLGFSFCPGAVQLP